MYRVILFLAIFLCQPVLSFEITYTNNSADDYWSSSNLGLDLLRLSEVQSYDSVAELDSAMAEGGNLNGWRFASPYEASSIFNLFDSDSSSDGWSGGQFAGSSLFNELMGLSVSYSEIFPRNNQGYDEYGHHAWSIVQADATTNEIWSGYISVCDPNYSTSVDCLDLLGGYELSGAGYLDFNPVGFMSNWRERSLSNNNGIFVVRSSTIAVPEPSTISIMLFALLLMALCSRLNWRGDSI